MKLPPAARLALASGKSIKPQEASADIRRMKDTLIDRFDLSVVRRFKHLPLIEVAAGTGFPRRRLLKDDDVVGIHQNVELRPLISATDSANLLAANLAEELGYSGIGASVLVTDGGPGPEAPTTIHPDFGTCTGVGSPASCQLRTWLPLVPTGSEEHGLAVAAVVARAARGAGIHFADIGGAQCQDGSFDCISLSALYDALDWAVGNQTAYNIVAHNMSWGARPSKDLPCSTLDSVFGYVKSIGMVQVAAAGDDSTSGNVRSPFWPACNQHVVAVGTADIQSDNTFTWSITPTANAGPALSFVAPGVNITAGGVTASGSSMAAPHITAIYAVMMAPNAWYSLPIDDLTAHLGRSSVERPDPRSGDSYKVPIYYLAIPMHVRIDNAFDAGITLSQPALHSCGEDCLDFPIGTEVTITVPPEYLITPCWGSTPNSCQVYLEQDLEMAILPNEVLPAVMDLFPAPLPQVFANGFEGAQ